jgi:ArsR family transcriptional regulator, lead/cadmium/zinc/bismuth-responsive transcriptional repressor
VRVNKRGKKELVRRSVLEQIFKEMLYMRRRLDDIENRFSNLNPPSVHVAESELISLPDHLRRTYVVVASKGQCDAIQVSNLTGRCRAIESNYLNQLSRMGWLKKLRISKEVHFCPISKADGGKYLATNLIQETLNFSKPHLRLP